MASPFSKLSFIFTILLLWAVPLPRTGTVLLAEPPKKLSIEASEKLIEEGDRLADQADYLEAVERYTDAYLGIVSKMRGQEFAEDVDPTMMTRTELAAEMKRQMEIEYTPEELALIEGSFKAFGLIPKTLSVRETMTKLLTEEVGGFYDPRTKAMVLIREDDRARQPGFLGKLLGQRPTFDKEEQKVTLSHELTHALQDQLYGLLQMQLAIEKDDDMILAFSALVEGDATLLMFGEMGRQEGETNPIAQMDPEQAQMMFSFMKMILPIAGGKTYRGAPPIFRDTLIFPYFQGMIFNLHLSGQAGFQKIHAAYQSPPVSTEQILHPAKFLGELDKPWEISIPDPKQWLKAPWKHLGGNCLGEFQISILLKQVAGGLEASEGWDGDRYEIFEHENGSFAFAWVTTWDTLEDANQFVAAFEKYCERRSPAVQHRIERDGMDVRIVQGLDENETSLCLDSLKRATKKEKEFPAKPIPLQPSR